MCDMSSKTQGHICRAIAGAAPLMPLWRDALVRPLTSVFSCPLPLGQRDGLKRQGWQNTRNDLYLARIWSPFFPVARLILGDTGRMAGKG
ncbi:hypothetical protein N7490_002964 [Penicillium lividum]|nr:hypothetical protein N7490_002964 [Penicillium lividum]